MGTVSGMPTATVLRLASWNLFSGRALGDERVDLERAAATLAALDADVVALQEVDRCQPRSGRADQARLLGERLGMRCCYTPTLLGELGGRAGVRAHDPAGADPGGAAYGIALLSRLPLERVAAVALPRAGAEEPRAALVALVGRCGGAVTVAVTHLSNHPRSSLVQLRALQRRLATWPPPRLLAGDLNQWLPLVRLASLPGWRPLVRGRTFPNPPPGRLRPTVQIDHILASDPQGRLRVRRTRVHAGPGSDHRAVLVELEVGPAAGGYAGRSNQFW